MKLKLKEVLWEITSRCNRNCDYCGSKHILNSQDEPIYNTRAIFARAIAEMKPDRVTLTGGEPLTLEDGSLEIVKSIMDEYGVKLDVVTNGDKLKLIHYKLFDSIGISINTLEDVARYKRKPYKDKVEGLIAKGTHVVFIANINRLNYFDIEEVVKLAAGFGIIIQFQLTMYKNDDPAKIDGGAIVETRKRIFDLCVKYKVDYVFADNLQQNHDCHAGMSSCGVLYNGDVVACLSERSWNNNMKTYGNLMGNNTLDEIWRTGFRDQRFGECNGCRDCFTYYEDNEEDDIPDIGFFRVESKKPQITIDEWDKKDAPIYKWDKKDAPISPNIVLYGLPPKDTYVYGVSRPFDQYPNVDVYGVYDITTSDGTTKKDEGTNGSN